MIKYEPNKEGQNHINIYTKSKLPLGRDLSHFANIGFVDKETGFCFKTMEGYWYWTSTGGADERFKTLPGFQCKMLGKAMPRAYDTGFTTKIKNGNRQKIEQNPALLKAFIASTLPFAHYYNYNGKIIYLDELDWLVKSFEELRFELRIKHGK